jgi:HEPN domain-containing protein
MRGSAGEARRWLEQAENDLDFCRLALRERYFAQACFGAQQTAEKALKSLAYGRSDRTVIGPSVVEIV